MTRRKSSLTWEGTLSLIVSDTGLLQVLNSNSSAISQNTQILISTLGSTIRSLGLRSEVEPWSRIRIERLLHPPSQTTLTIQTKAGTRRPVCTKRTFLNLETAATTFLNRQCLTPAKAQYLSFRVKLVGF